MFGSRDVIKHVISLNIIPNTLVPYNYNHEFVRLKEPIVAHNGDPSNGPLVQGGKTSCWFTGLFWP
jgi:hypothetical protein